MTSKPDIGTMIRATGMLRVNSGVSARGRCSTRVRNRMGPSGRQYVVVLAGGACLATGPKGDAVVAFALSD